jgi:hypothetical protein
MTTASNTEDTVLSLRPDGANVNFTENEKFHSILDAVTIQHLVTQLAEPRGLGPLNYIGGGAPGLVSSMG